MAGVLICPDLSLCCTHKYAQPNLVNTLQPYLPRADQRVATSVCSGRSGTPESLRAQKARTPPARPLPEAARCRAESEADRRWLVERLQALSQFPLRQHSLRREPAQAAGTRPLRGDTLATGMPAESAASCAASPPAHASDAPDGSSGIVAAASGNQLLLQQDAQGLTLQNRALVRASADLESQLPRAARVEGSAAVCSAATSETQDSQLLRPTAGVDVHASAAVPARQPLAEARLLPEGQGGPLPAQTGKGSTQPAESRSPNRAPRASGKPKSPAYGGKSVGKRLPTVGGAGLKGMKDTNFMPGAQQIPHDGSAATMFLATYVVDFGAVAIGTLKVYSL